jgi:hypothetical protein
MLPHVQLAGGAVRLVKRRSMPEGRFPLPLLHDRTMVCSEARWCARGSTWKDSCGGEGSLSVRQSMCQTKLATDSRVNEASAV